MPWLEGQRVATVLGKHDFQFIGIGSSRLARGRDGIVASRDALPETLPRHALPYLCLLARADDDWVVRLAGFDVSSRYGAPLVGQPLRAIVTGEDEAARRARFDEAAANGRFLCEEVAYSLLGLRTSYLRLIQPLTDANGHVRRMLLCLQLTRGLPLAAATDPEVVRIAEGVS